MPPGGTNIAPRAATFAVPSSAFPVSFAAPLTGFLTAARATFFGADALFAAPRFLAGARFCPARLLVAFLAVVVIGVHAYESALPTFSARWRASRTSPARRRTSVNTDARSS